MISSGIPNTEKEELRAEITSLDEVAGRPCTTGKLRIVITDYISTIYHLERTRSVPNFCHGLLGISTGITGSFDCDLLFV